MLKKLLLLTLSISAIFYQYPLRGSDAPQAQPTQKESASASSRNDQGFWHTITNAMSKIALDKTGSYAPHAAAGACALATAYGGYQVWRKFIFDPQLRSMKKELEKDILAATQQNKEHVSQEIKASEARQMLHTTKELHTTQDRLQSGQRDLGLHIASNHTENKKNFSQLAQAQAEHKQHIAKLDAQCNTNHQEVMTRLNNSQRPATFLFPNAYLAQKGFTPPK